MTTIATQAPGPSTRFAWARPVLFHLAPGIGMAVAFAAIAWLVRPLDWPPSLAILLAWALVGVPLLMGTLLHQGRQLNGTWSLHGILLYRTPLPWRQYAWIVPVLLVWAALASTLLYPLAEFLRLNLFAAWPQWLSLSSLVQSPTRYSTSILWTIVALSAVLNLVVPITEELYFRSFLLPRLPVPRRLAPLVSTVLFSLYHFWLPWDFIGRIITLLPVVYVVQWKQNVYVSILVHCILNLMGTVGLALIIMGVA
jgi:uncharacterized protein